MGVLGSPNEEDVKIKIPITISACNISSRNCRDKGVNFLENPIVSDGDDRRKRYCT